MVSEAERKNKEGKTEQIYQHHDNMSVLCRPPYTKILYSKSKVYRGLYYFLIFFLKNIDCGYSLESRF